MLGTLYRIAQGDKAGLIAVVLRGQGVGRRAVAIGVDLQVRARGELDQVAGDESDRQAELPGEGVAPARTAAAAEVGVDAEGERALLQELEAEAE